MPVSIRTLKELAHNIRSALDSCDRSGWGVLFESFPNGSCGAAAEILGHYLIDRHGLIPTYVSGTWYEDETRVSSHAWLELEGVIIDITGDQFGEPAVVVTRDSAWFARFANQGRRELVADDKWWLQYCARAYRDIIGRIDGA